MSGGSDKVGNKFIFYDVSDGKVLVVEGRKNRVLDVDETILKYKELTGRVRESFDFLELGYTDYAQDFAESNNYRVNPETKELEFSYPDPNEPEEEPVYQKSLSEEIEELKQENMLLNLKSQSLTDRSEFLEEVMTEIILNTVP